jgi:hypothetical protein
VDAVSRRSPRGPLVVLVLGLLTLLLTGCGVQLQGEAEPLAGGLPPTSSPSPTPTATEKDTRIYFVAGRQLEGVPEPITERSADGIMAALAAGPPVDREAQLRSLLLDPLTGAPLLLVAGVTPSGVVYVQRTDGYLTLPATDQILLTGQVVHSMDEIDLSPMVMVDATGTPVPITLPDGRVAEGGVTADDFAALLVN